MIARPENKEQLDFEIKRANVICLVYAVDRMEQNHIAECISRIRNLGKNIPVILVGNKTDLLPNEDAMDAIEAQILPLLNEYKEIVACLQCSAKKIKNVSEVYFFAIKSVLYPTTPLYDSVKHVLKPAFVSALKRIFLLCDKDRDGFLSLQEIHHLNMKAFGVPLQVQELEKIRQVTRENHASHWTDSGLSQKGFLFLNSFFIQNGKLETPWSILRSFGYDDDLSLRADFLEPPMEVNPPDGIIELSSEGIQFFTNLFQRADVDKDGALDESEWKELFKTAPQHPWISQLDFPKTTMTDENDSITLQGFLSQWNMTTHLNYKTTLSYLAYLGYPDAHSDGDTRTALQIINPRKRIKNVLVVYVLGATGCGKTSLLKGLLSRTFDSTYTPTNLEEYKVVHSVQVRGMEKDLVLIEYGPQFEAEILSNPKKLEFCDVLCFVYDSSDANSFSYVANLRLKYKLDHLPMVFVATKSDLDLVPQRYQVSPDLYCRSLGLAIPISVSMKQNLTADLYRLLVGVAMDPNVAIPGTRKRPNLIVKGAVATLTLTLLGVTLYYGLKWFHRIK